MMNTFVKYVMMNTRLTNQSIIKVKYIYKNNIITEKLNFPCLSSCLERKKTVSFRRIPTILCRPYAGSHNCCEYECNFCVTPRRQHLHLTRPFLQLLHFFFHKIPRVLMRKDDTHVPFMAGHLKITYFSAESSYRSLDSFLTTANRKEPLAPKLTTPLSMGRGTVI